MSLDQPFRLTPGTGEHLRDAAELADRHNVRAVHVGHNSMETSLGRSLLLTISQRAALAGALADLGPLTLDEAPVVESGAVRVPATALRVHGEAIRLSSQRLTLGGLGLGRYALVIELWRALVGPTTAGRAEEPRLYATVTDAAAKPSATTLYPAGCTDLTDGPSDAPLVTATVQTQKFEQWQYRLRLIADGDLAAYDSSLIPRVPRYEDLPQGEQVAGAAYAPLGAGLYEARLPDRPESRERAFDRRLYAAKLAVVSLGPAGPQVLTRALDDLTDWGASPPAAILPGRLELARAVAARQADHERRLGQIEASRGALDFVTNEPFAVADLTAGGSLEARAVPFPAATGALRGVAHDPQAAPSAVRATEAGRFRVTASVTFAPGAAGLRGVSLLRNLLPTGFAQQVSAATGDETSLSLSAELDLLAGERLHLEVRHRAGAVLSVTNARLSISRVS